MTDAPERIWAWEIDHETFPSGYYALAEADESIEYIRSDLAPDPAQYQRMKEALEDIADGLGEISLREIGRYAPVVARAALAEEKSK